MAVQLSNYVSQQKAPDASVGRGSGLVVKIRRAVQSDKLAGFSRGVSQIAEPGYDLVLSFGLSSTSALKRSQASFVSFSSASNSAILVFAFLSSSGW